MTVYNKTFSIATEDGPSVHGSSSSSSTKTKPRRSQHRNSPPQLSLIKVLINQAEEPNFSLVFSIIFWLLTLTLRKVIVKMNVAVEVENKHDRKAF